MDASEALESGTPDTPDAPVDATEPPGVEEERRGDPLTWRRWKGSFAEIAQIFRLADELVEKALGEKLDPTYGGRIVVHLQGRERSFRALQDFEAELDDFDPASVQGLMKSTGYGTDKVRIMVNFDRSTGAWATVSGKDQFAVAGVQDELKSALNRGRRWTQVGGRWPQLVSFWAPWVAIFGLSLMPLIGGDTGRFLGFLLVGVAVLMLATVLFMEYVEPRLVPPLELLDKSEQQTVSQRWKGRALKAAGFAVAAVAGAAINSFTGVLF